jgi:ABC-type sugar transport system ATPase subunit
MAAAHEGVRVPDTLVSVQNVSVRFGQFTAVDDVSIDIRRGSVHALVGENGAGKSTLGKVISGVYSPTSGTIIHAGIGGQAADESALRLMVGVVDQELALLPERSVTENVLLGNLPRRLGIVDRRAMRREIDQLLDLTGFALDPDSLVGSLRVADRQQVGILRALASNRSLVVMDEPTAALTRTEADRLLGIIDRMRREGTTFVFISHFLDEVLRIADEVTVLKDGRRTWTGPASAATPDSLVQAMLGRSLPQLFPKRRVQNEREVILVVDRLRSGREVDNISLQIKAGEIVGVAGIVGSGRSELAHAIIGARRRDSGTVTLNGAEFHPRSPQVAWRSGVAFLPESRRDQGLFLGHSVLHNVVLPHLSAFQQRGMLPERAGEQQTEQLLGQMRYQGDGIRIPVGSLSGGNQQKVLFARCLLASPRLLIVDEPSRGVDIGARAALYSMIVDAADRGAAVMVVSSELEEVIGLSDRIVAMRAGRIVAEFPADPPQDALLCAILGADFVPDTEKEPQ